MELVSNYRDFSDLQLLLQSLPPPDWLPMPRQTHYSVGGSGYYGCPEKDQRISNPFFMVR